MPLSWSVVWFAPGAGKKREKGKSEFGQGQEQNSAPKRREVKRKVAECGKGYCVLHLLFGTP